MSALGAAPGAAAAPSDVHAPVAKKDHANAKPMSRFLFPFASLVVQPLRDLCHRTLQAETCGVAR